MSASSPGGTTVVVIAEQLRRSVPGGIGTYVRGLLGGLAALGRGEAADLDLSLYASRPRRGGDPLLALGFPLVTSRLPGPVLTRGWDRALIPVPGRFDVVHAPSLAVPPAGRGALVVVVHDMAWRRIPEAYPPRGRRWHEAALQRALERATHFVTPSEPVARELVAEGVAAAAVTQVPLGADHLPDPDEESAAALLGRLGVTGPFLLTVGTLEPRKNLTRLFDAYARARPSLPSPLPLVVVGPAGWGPVTPAHPGVVLAGGVSGATLAALYRRAVLLAYVPLEEGFGLPVAEAMHAGTPVVASPVPSAGGAAVEVAPERVDEIADAIARVVTDEGLRSRLSAQGSARAGALTWRSVARAHAELWASLR